MLKEEFPKQWYIECKTEEQKVALALYAGFTWKANFIYHDENGHVTHSSELSDNRREYTEITYDEFRRHVLIVSDEVPERWYIHLDEVNRALINEWKVKQEFDDDLFINPDYKCVVENGAGKDKDPKSEDGYREKITTKQFIEHVLNTTLQPPQSYEYLVELFTTLNIQ